MFLKLPPLRLAHLFVALASICKAVKDTLAFHWGSSVFKEYNPNFWNPNVSWMNKYKNWPDDPSPAFPLANNALVWLTDAWHLFDMLTLIFLLIAVHLKGNIFYAIIIYAVVFNGIYYWVY